MAAGDLLTGNYQVELQEVLMGDGTDYGIYGGSFEGLGLPSVKTQDTELAHRSGSVGGREYLGPRILTWSMFIHKSTDALAQASFATLLAAFQPVVADVELHLQLPGWGHISVDGRPRALPMTNPFPGRLEMMAMFVALDPTVTTIP